MKELPLKEIPHLSCAYGQFLVEDGAFGLELPYTRLRGPGFERLCYHLLLSQGKTPRFYGVTGQAQFGVDLIVSNGEDCEVYQCKNQVGFNHTDLSTALEIFEKNWDSGQPGFPRPTSFTICVPERLQGRSEWEDVKSSFCERTKIHVTEWDRNFLDIGLKSLPDAVSDLFGDQVAERFCGLSDWADGRWTRLVKGLDRNVDRYLTLVAGDRLAMFDELAESFSTATSLQDVILLEGASGTGKTVTGLALAQMTGRRVNYFRVDSTMTDDILFYGLKTRVVRDTIFVLDDCHFNWDVIERVMRRLVIALRGRPYKIVLIGQTAPEGLEISDMGANEFVEQLRADGGAILIEASNDKFRDVLCKAYPAWNNASDEQVQRISALTAGNLAVLDLIAEIDDLLSEDVRVLHELAGKLAAKWFGTTSPTAPQLHAFASVAQFEIKLQAEANWSDPERTAYPSALRRFVLREGHRGPVWRFSHAREAELVTRVLSSIQGKDWEKVTCDHMVECLTDLSGRFGIFLDNFDDFIRRRLTLADDRSLKSAVLSNERVIDVVVANIREIPLGLVSVLAFILRNEASSVVYGDLLVRRIEAVLDEPEMAEQHDIGQLGMSIRMVGLIGGVTQSRISNPKMMGAFLGLFEIRGTIVELFQILQYSSPDFAAGLIAALDESRVTRLIDKAIETGRSIGTLNLSLRELADRDMPDGRKQLQALQGLIGGAQMVRLIEANGTIFELFQILQYSSPDFAAGLILALDEARVTRLIDKTIETGRSIGALGLTLRDLADRDMPDGRKQLQALQGMIGGAQMLRLIEANGTIVELYKILQYSSPGFAAGLILALDEARVARLIDKTIETGRSIGTLGFSLRDLADRDMPDGRKQLQALQGMIGGAQMLRLIEANGTIFDLFQILQRSSPDFAAGLILALDEARVTRLIDKTIKEGRSIGTLNYTLRELARRPYGSGETQRIALESKIYPSEFWRLVEGVGDLSDLRYLLTDISNLYRGQLLGADVAPDIDGWRMLVRRGTLFHLALFSQEALPLFSASVQGAFRIAAVAELQSLVGKANWFELSTGWNRANQMMDENLRLGMKETILVRISTTDPLSLKGLDFNESSNAILLLSQQVPSSHAQLAKDFWTILPDRRTWPQDHALFVTGGLLLRAVVNDQFSVETVKDLMDLFWPKLPEQALSSARSDQISIFLWSLHESLAYWHEKARILPMRSPEHAEAALFSRLERLVASAKSDQDKLGVLKLAGLIDYLWPVQRSQLDTMIRRRIVGFSRLSEASLDLTFVPAVFATLGLTFIGPRQVALSADRIGLIMTKLADYEFVSPQVAELGTYFQSLAPRRRS